MEHSELKALVGRTKARRRGQQRTVVTGKSSNSRRMVRLVRFRSRLLVRNQLARKCFRQCSKKRFEGQKHQTCTNAKVLNLSRQWNQR